MSPYEPPTEDGPDPDRLRDEAWDRKHLAAAPLIFVDGDPAGCKCTSRCEFPCWQRVGLTDKPCCWGCAPLDAS